MIRCPSCGATNADGRRLCTVCDARLDRGQTAEIESDIAAALAGLGAMKPPPAYFVRDEGPKTPFGKHGHGGALDDFSHSDFDDPNGLPQTFVNAPQMPAAAAQSPPQSQGHDAAGGTVFGIGSTVDEEESAETTVFDVGDGDPSQSVNGTSVPDWVAGLEEEIRSSEEFDRFVGSSPPSSVFDQSPHNGDPPATPGGAAAEPVDRFQIPNQTHFGIPGESEVEPTVLLHGRPAPLIPLAPNELALAEGSGVLKRRSRPTSKRDAASPSPGAKRARDLRLESPPPTAQPDASRPNTARSTPHNDPPRGDILHTPPAKPTPRAPKANPDKPLELADTGALDAFSQPRNTPGSPKGLARPTPAPTPAPPRGPAPVPRTPSATAPDAAWEVFVPSATELALTELAPTELAPTELAPNASGSEQTHDAEQREGVAEANTRDFAPAQVKQPLSDRRIVVTVAIVVTVVCLAFGLFLVWLVDRA